MCGIDVILVQASLVFTSIECTAHSKELLRIVALASRLLLVDSGQVGLVDELILANILLRKHRSIGGRGAFTLVR